MKQTPSDFARCAANVSSMEWDKFLFWALSRRGYNGASFDYLMAKNHDLCC